MNVIDFLGLQVSTNADITPVGEEIARDAASLYFKSAAIDTAISYVTGALASCEVRTYDRDEEKRGVLYHLLNLRTNPNQNAAQFKAQFFYNLMYWGEALAVVVKDHLYVADGFAVDKVQFGNNMFRSVSVDGLNCGIDFSADECLYMTYDNKRSRKLIDGIYSEYAQLMSSATDSFKAAAGTKWILTVDRSPTGTREFAKKDQEEQTDPRNAMQMFMRHSNSVYRQTRGQSLEKVDVNGCSADDIIKIRKDAYESTAGIYKIPPPMIFGNMTNLNDNVDAFLTFAIKPIAKQFEEELTSKFIDAPSWGDGSRLVVDTSRIKFVDIFGIAPSISQLIGSGFSLDEMRGQIDWPLIGTDQSQEHLITRNFGPLDEVFRQLSQGGEK